ncbi:hypothetical protein KBD09_00450 [Candidatus Woesebacteria bacterium]|nr:hypothetical protein [Candidatus Woesebacteria bacterium]
MVIDVPITDGYAGMVAVVHAEQSATFITEVELVFDEDDEARLIDRIYGLGPRREWDYLGLGYEFGEGGKSELDEIRLMRKIDPESAPSWTGLIPDNLTYNGVLYRYDIDYGGRSVIIGPNNEYRIGIMGRWVTYKTQVDGVTLLLVYFRSADGRGVYAGQLVPQDSVKIFLAEVGTNRPW